MARDGGFDGARPLLHQRLDGIKGQAQRPGLVNLGKQPLRGPSMLAGPGEQRLKRIASYLNFASKLIDGDLKELFYLLIGEIGGFKQKLGEGRVAGDDG